MGGGVKHVGVGGPIGPTRKNGGLAIGKLGVGRTQAEAVIGPRCKCVRGGNDTAVEQQAEATGLGGEGDLDPLRLQRACDGLG